MNLSRTVVSFVPATAFPIPTLPHPCAARSARHATPHFLSAPLCTACREPLVNIASCEMLLVLLYLSAICDRSPLSWSKYALFSASRGVLTLHRPLSEASIRTILILFRQCKRDTINMLLRTLIQTRRSVQKQIAASRRPHVLAAKRRLTAKMLDDVRGGVWCETNEQRWYT